ncbi:chemotaxis protein CheW [Pseudanabaena sp. FACHB-1998]|uniref:chemotaxis protein CheW n=1 Tax=Pseudanabaena sp. FACHB-1998 TaxID=2692858 RepID=UPI001681BBA5|nr:chemotaxis protein CheW [Pseudanabaena sp. FACHB-1998]MBD2178942.1 chemotaxis protein CheW [Pseudanabaena sp. FACHB-1998]
MIQEYCRLRVSPLLRIAIPITSVDEVIQLQPQDISPIPGVNPCLVGLTNQRGRLLWVLHLEKFLGMKPMPLGKPIMAIAIRSQIPTEGIRCLACVVMAVEEIMTIDSQKLIPVPEIAPPSAKVLLSGIAKLDKNTYGVLNVKELFRLLNPDMDDSNEIPELAGISTA